MVSQTAIQRIDKYLYEIPKSYRDDMRVSARFYADPVLLEHMLGDKSLEFIYFPWVHWPETMLTYLKEDRILFPCDLFSSHLATSDLYVTDEGQIYEASKRFYAEIMMPFRTNIQKSWDKLDDYQIDIIAPSHGPLHHRPEFIRQAYHEWVFSEPKNTVVLPYISMHGSTRLMVEYFVGALIERGVTV